MEVVGQSVECAGRALAGLLATKDRKTMASLLRLAAKYLEAEGPTGGEADRVRHLAPGAGGAVQAGAKG
jgi:hypothetical protein